jgi:heme-degrading monooxygenase HmoA
MGDGFARLPEPPYWAVIFSSQRTDDATQGDAGYGAAADRMVALCEGMPGFLGLESTRDAAGFGMTVCYWRSEEDIAAWKRHAEHQAAQAQGHAKWYAHFELRVAKVERAYGMGRPR